MMKAWMSENSGAATIIGALMGFIAAVSLMDMRLTTFQEAIARDLSVVREDVREIRSVMFIPFRPEK